MIPLPRTDRDNLLGVCTCSPRVECATCRIRREVEGVSLELLARWYPLLDAQEIQQQLNWPTPAGGRL